MVPFSEIQQLPDFLDLFPGNFFTICPRFENFGIIGQMVRAPRVWVFNSPNINQIQLILRQSMQAVTDFL